MTNPEITALAGRLESTAHRMGTRRREDYLASITVAEAVQAATALRALLAERDGLRERLQAIIDWADFAMFNPQEFDCQGVRNLDGPVFDEARQALSALTPKEPEHG